MAARAEIGDRADDEIVLHGTNLRRCARDLADVSLCAFGRHFARQQHDAVVAGGIDVEGALEALDDRRDDLVLDDLVVELCSGGTAVGRDQCRAAGPSHHQRNAPLQEQCGNRGYDEHERGGAPKRMQGHASSPSKLASIASQRQWMVSRCTS